MDSTNKIASDMLAASCYFRSSVRAPYRKALLQITERCNLHCAHCFVSAGNYGDTMPLEVIQNTVIPRLKACRVVKVTLTGGEPFVHPDILEIVRSLRNSGMGVGVCTNATNITDEQIDALVKIGGVHVNVSLDGFRPESHGRFRGNADSFATTIETIRKLAQKKLLQGILVTPNNLAEVEEYGEICDFAAKNGANYVLMNPLSRLGRGAVTKNKFAQSRESMQKISELADKFASHVELVRIRFPNDKKLPLASCEAGNIIYVFVHGEITVCPYLIFAAKTPQSKHKPEEFIAGNILNDADIAAKLDAYNFHERYELGGNATCRGCAINSQCGKGCPAAIIASGQHISGLDKEVCPVVDEFGG